MNILQFSFIPAFERIRLVRATASTTSPTNRLWHQSYHLLLSVSHPIKFQPIHLTPDSTTLLANPNTPSPNNPPQKAPQPKNPRQSPPKPTPRTPARSQIRHSPREDALVDPSRLEPAAGPLVGAESAILQRDRATRALTVRGGGLGSSGRAAAASYYPLRAARR